MIAILFLIAATSLLAYTMAGYPVLLYLRSRMRSNPVRKSEDYQPTITVIIAAHNEEKTIRRKLASIFNSNYPTDRLDVIVASDGSDDNTNSILAAWNDSRVRLLALER